MTLSQKLSKLKTDVIDIVRGGQNLTEDLTIDGSPVLTGQFVENWTTARDEYDFLMSNVGLAYSGRLTDERWSKKGWSPITLDVELEKVKHRLQLEFDRL